MMFVNSEAAVYRYSAKYMFLKIFAKFTETYLCQSFFFTKVADLQPTTLTNKETPAQVFFCVLKNIYFIEHLRTTLSENYNKNFFTEIQAVI